MAVSVSVCEAVGVGVLRRLAVDESGGRRSAGSLHAIESGHDELAECHLRSRKNVET